jgi:hypothetical protein
MSITRSEDLVGHCGLGTSGDAGHIVVFDRWDQDHVTRSPDDTRSRPARRRGLGPGTVIPNQE